MRILTLIIVLSFNCALAFCADDQAALSRVVSNLLEAGFQSGRVSTLDLEAAYNKAVDELGRSDPHLDYAYSIVLRKNFDATESKVRLASSASSEVPVVFLAREEVILEGLKKGRFDEAMLQLEDLAQQIGKITPQSFQFQDAKRSAGWLGQVLAFLEGPLGHEIVKGQARELDASVVKSLGKTFGGAYQTGRLKTSLRRQELLAAIDQTKEVVQLSNEELAAEAKKQAKAIESQQEVLKEKVGEFQDVANDELSDLNSKLEVLEQQFEASLETEKVMIITATDLRLQIQQLRHDLETSQSGFGTINQPNRRTQQNDRIEQAITIRERELLIMSRDHGLLLDSRGTLLALANQMLKKRSQLGAHYNAAGSSARAQNDRFERMQLKVEKLKEKAFSSLDSDPKVIAQLRAIKTFTSYEKRSLEREKELLVNSLSEPE